MFLILSDYKSFFVPTEAMLNTLQVGDYFIADFNAYDSNNPQPNDIMIFIWPVDKQTKYVKRCIGIPGDTIEIVEKEIFVNGKRFEFNEAYEKFDSPSQVGAKDNFGPSIVPADFYFVLGDNIGNSYDSRYWGPVHRDLIMGKAVIIHWSRSWNRIGKKL
jgi:signal peptidase I